MIRHEHGRWMVRSEDGRSLGSYTSRAAAVADAAAAPDPIRQFVRERIDRDGWGPFEALAYAKDRDKVSILREAYALSQLCSDPTARQDPLHSRLHAGQRLTACVGPQYVHDTGRALGFSPARIKRICDHMEQESRALEGLVGSMER